MLPIIFVLFSYCYRFVGGMHKVPIFPDGIKLISVNFRCFIGVKT